MLAHPQYVNAIIRKLYPSSREAAEHISNFARADPLVRKACDAGGRGVSSESCCAILLSGVTENCRPILCIYLVRSGSAHMPLVCRSRPCGRPTLPWPKFGRVRPNWASFERFWPDMGHFGHIWPKFGRICDRFDQIRPITQETNFGQGWPEAWPLFCPNWSLFQGIGRFRARIGPIWPSLGFDCGEHGPKLSLVCVSGSGKLGQHICPTWPDSGQHRSKLGRTRPNSPKFGSGQASRCAQVNYIRRGRRPELETPFRKIVFRS